MIHGILHNTAHRPWPLPARPWVMTQSWHNLLFAHWPVAVEALRPHVPAALPIDTYKGNAWLGVVPFYMTNVRPRFTPALPGLSAFAELNVRTYVILDRKPGVWFFSLDAANPLAVAAARLWFGLPYFRASMNCEEMGGDIRYHSERTHSGAPAAVLQASYKPTGEVFEPQPGTLEYFLTERYCLYAARPGGKIYRGEIHHPPWHLQKAEGDFAENSMAAAAGITLPNQEPLLHFARRQDMVAWAPQRVL